MNRYRNMSEEILRKAKENSAEYYLTNKSKERYKSLSQEEKVKLKSTKEKGTKNWLI